MPQKRGHVHALQRAAAQPLAHAVDKRIVTIYTTLTSSDWIGGDLTTLSPSASDKAQGINHRVNDPPALTSTLPSAISITSDGASMTVPSGPLAVQSPISSTSSTSSSPTETAMSSATSAAAASETSASSSSSSSGSTDVATKAGIALGVLGGLFVILVTVYFIIVRRRKQLAAQRAAEADNEKLNGSLDDDSPRASSAPTKPPRISLGPMTGLFTFSNANQAETAQRPTTSTSSNVSENPFTNQAQIHDGGLAPAPINKDNAKLSPLLTKDLPRSPPRSVIEVSPIESDVDTPEGHALAGDHPPGATVSVMERQPSERRQSVRKSNVPAPLDLTLPPKMPYAVPPSPAGTEFSMAEMEPGQSPYPSAGAASIAAAGGPSNTTVHRVQLDFKPTLDDELELQAGQVVRLLHEYDDGWALCIRLDRSQQGVVPRSCLSARPVKPRLPQGGGHRGPPVNPQAGPRGPGFPNGGRPLGPPAGQRGPGPLMRPAGPGVGPGSRPQSPNDPSHRPTQPTQGAQQGPVETQLFPNESHLPGQAY